MNIYLTRLLVSMLLCLSSLSFAQDVSQSNSSQSNSSQSNSQGTGAPPQLEAWTSWIMHSHPQHGCTYIAVTGRSGSGGSDLSCAWPGRLQLSLTNKGGSFTQMWQLEKDSNIPLPSQNELWPMDVTVNGKPAQLGRDKASLPFVKLPKGQSMVSGHFTWSDLPQRLRLPRNTALLSLSVNGQAIASPSIKNGNMLWLKQDTGSEKGERDNIKIEVFRMLVDGVPRRLLTHVRLTVSGKPRELSTGRLGLANTMTEAFQSALPARIEENGQLRIQLRSGEWELNHQARVLGNINEFSLHVQDDKWPKQELWAVQADTNIRMIKVEGPRLFDAANVDAPVIFADAPVYLLEPDITLSLIEQSRGDHSPQANDLNLSRTLWLDFDGGGATVKDLITGKMHQGWRLDMGSKLVLGNADTDGQPHIVTELKDENKSSGVELRSSRVDLSAVSRLDNSLNIPANGWLSDFSQVDHTLNLPPSWRVWHVSGPDRVVGSWLSKWNLWDIFLCLILVGALYKLLGIFSAVIAVLTGLLTFHSQGSIYLALIPFIVLLPLLKVLPQNRLLKVTQYLSVFLMLAVTLNFIGFMSEHMRSVIYPQLEPKPHASGVLDQRKQQSHGVREKAMTPSKRDRLGMASIEAEADEVVVSGFRAASSPVPQRKERYDASEAAQTGPGLPSWGWQSIHYSWTGIVKQGDSMALYYTGPWLTKVIRLLEVILSALLMVLIFKGLFPGLKSMVSFSSLKHTAATSTAWVLFILVSAGVLLGSSHEALASNFPSESLLKEYEKRLLQAPKCGSNCYSINQGRVRLENNILSVSLSVATFSRIAMPLPTGQRWQPKTVLLNGQQIDYVKKQGGTDFIILAEGVFDIELKGKINDDAVTLTFPRHSHNIFVSSSDWLATGLKEGRLNSSTLSFERISKQEVKDRLLPDIAKPFVHIERRFDFGLDWRVYTEVVRVAPLTGVIAFEYPLLKNEQILSDGLVVKNGQVQLLLDANQGQVNWVSELTPVSPLYLMHPKNDLWRERWNVNSSERWHVKSEGILPIKGGQGSEKTWQVWPGESVTLRLVRPDGVPSATTTVDNVKINVVPGKRSSKGELSINIRSSVGGQYFLVLPSELVIKSLSLNNAQVNESVVEGRLPINLPPGKSHVLLKWEHNQEMGLVTSLPALGLQSDSRNISIHYQVPRDRWLLWVNGPQLGPALLFWSVFTILVIMACALGALGKRFAPSIPVNTWQWLLLGLGVSTVSDLGGLLIVGWFVVMHVRFTYGSTLSPTLFNLLQVGLVLMTLAVGVILIAVIPSGLLSTPDMKVVGGGSSATHLSWYADYTQGLFPNTYFVSVSIWYYRLAMLVWSVWLVFSLIRWSAWGWRCFSVDGLWQQVMRANKVKSVGIEKSTADSVNKIIEPQSPKSGD